MQPVVSPPLWAVYLVNKRDLIVVPLALGLALLLAIRVSRSLGRLERTPYQPLTLLPDWLIALAAGLIFYVGFSQVLTGLAVLVQGVGAGLNWSFNPPFAPIVPNEPVYFFDAGVIVIAALWILFTGREYPAVAADAKPEAEAAAEAEPSPLASAEDGLSGT